MNQHIADMIAQRDAEKNAPRNVQSAGEIALGQGAEEALSSSKKITALMEQAATQNQTLLSSLTPEIRALAAKQIGISDQNAQIGKELYAQGQTFAPVQAKLISDTLQAGDQNAAAATAKADSDQQFQASMDAARRSMIAQGINPNDARYTDIILSGGGQHAADTAGAVTNARRAALMTGINAGTNTANLGQNVTNSAVSASGAAANGINAAGQEYNNLITASAAPMAGYSSALDASSGMFKTQADLTAALAKTRADAEQNKFNNNLAATQVISGMNPDNAQVFAPKLGITMPVNTNGYYGLSGNRVSGPWSLRG